MHIRKLVANLKLLLLRIRIYDDAIMKLNKSVAHSWLFCHLCWQRLFV